MGKDWTHHGNRTGSPHPAKDRDRPGLGHGPLPEQELGYTLTTPYGYVLAQGRSVLDIYAATASVELLALEGKVEFIHEQTGSRFEVVAGSTSLLVDEKQVGPGTGCLDAAWGKWNETRDAWWAKRLECKGESAKYLHDSIREDACILDEHGRWSRVYYEGAYHHFWRPTRVGAGWAPFTAGS